METARILHVAATCYLAIISLTRESESSPCTSYRDIGNEYRSVNYTALPSESQLCDYYNIRDPGQWFRFAQYTGEKMPEYCPPLKSCGTQYPIWMNGSHPTVPHVVTPAVACTVKGLGDEYCCQKSQPMSVMLCANAGEPFYVYQLPVVDECPNSYCAGEMQPCDLSHYWDDTTSMCKEKPSSTTTTFKPTTTSNAFPSTKHSSKVELVTEPTQETAKNKTPTDKLIIVVAVVCSILGALVGALVIWYLLKKTKTSTTTKVSPGSSGMSTMPAHPPEYIEKPPPYTIT